MVEKIKNNLTVVAFFLGLFAFITIFFPAINIDMEKIMNVELLWNIEGTKVVFGMEMLDEKVLEFSFLAFMAYVLPLVGVILIYCADKKNDKNYWVGAALCFVVGAILLFLMPSLLEYGKYAEAEELERWIELGAGAIAGAVSSLLAAFSLLPTISSSFTVKKQAEETTL